MREHLPVKVTLIVEVDGHTLTYEETGKAMGARYEGGPAPVDYQDSILEKNIRGTVDTCIARAAGRSVTFLSRAYPIAARPRRG